MPTFLFKFKVVPATSHPEYPRIQQAEAVAMAVRPDLAAAEAVCRTYVTASHWEIISREEGRTVLLSQFDPTGAARDCFLNAQMFGVSAVFAVESVKPG